MDAAIHVFHAHPVALFPLLFLSPFYTSLSLTNIVLLVTYYLQSMSSKGKHLGSKNKPQVKSKQFSNNKGGERIKQKYLATISKQGAAKRYIIFWNILSPLQPQPHTHLSLA
jgi:hypothetical protein